MKSINFAKGIIITKVKLSYNSQQVIKKLKKNKLAMISLWFIVFCIIISVFAYQIIPDKTPNANNQLIEIAIRRPGFKVDMLKITPRSSEQQRMSLKNFFTGIPDISTYLPIKSYTIEGGAIEYETIDGIEGKMDMHSEESDIEVVSKRYIFGTDRYGRDVFSRLILGTRVSLSIGTVAVILSLLIGVFIGSIAGYFRGGIDKFLMWLINVVWAIPSLLLVIAISFALGRGFWQIFIAIGLTLWVDVARMVRGQVISIKEQEYIDAAKTLGYSSTRIIIHHLLPNIISPLLVISASNFATSILLEAGLSFLGIGVQPPMPSWGMMIKESYAYLILGYPYLSIIPGIAIMLLVLAFMLLGNGLRDALDVKN
ncbi:MAG: ABC transporter permease [Bacteroidales bacterium]|nr:ABC transporter permease [Bacteroidales bacterium]